MINIPRWRIILVTAISLLSLIYAVPTFLSPETQMYLQKQYPAWMPNKSVNLGLDLRGGSHLLLQADMEGVFKQKAEDLVSTIRTEFRNEKIELAKVATQSDAGVQVTLENEVDADKAERLLRGFDENLTVSKDGKTFSVFYDEKGRKKVTDQTISQSIEIVSRRVNESGTQEPIIQRQGLDRIVVQLPGVQDPERIKTLLGKTAKLTFHLVDIDGQSGIDSRELPLREDKAQKLPVKRRAILTGDMLVNAQPSFQEGAPVVSFRLNAIGSRRFCDVTKNNTGKPFAIVLDDEIISAPRINEAICGGSAVISGSFSVQEVNDVSVLLRAGALPAALTVVEERSVGPSLGSDSIKSGMIAGIFAFGLIVVFMIANYGLFGVFASVALVVNLGLTFSVMALIGATLTLPGIAGLVLTLGTAVDSNVLIFERMREEAAGGKSIIAAMHSGFEKAMTSIVDSNLTSLISGAILYMLGTGPIKGFAVTLTVGILTSLFSAIMLTRLILSLWYKYAKPKTLPIA